MCYEKRAVEGVDVHSCLEAESLLKFTERFLTGRKLLEA